MAEKSISLPLDFLASKLKIDAAELSEALKIGEGDEALHADSLKELGSKFDKIFEDKFDEGKAEGHGEAKRKVLTDAERAFADKFDLKRSSFIEMGEALLSKAASTDTLTPNDIRNSDTYLNDIKEKEEEITNLKSKFESVQSEFTKDRVKRVAISQFKEALEGYDLSNDNLVSLLVDKAVNDYNVSLSEDGKDILFMDDKGQRIRTSGKEFLTFKDHVQSNYSDRYFGKADPNPTPGGKTKPMGNPSNYTFKNQEEANKAFENAKSPEEKEAIIEAVQLQQDNW